MEKSNSQLRQRAEVAATRREFLRAMAAAGAATMIAGEPRLLRADQTGAAIRHPMAKADACILLWMVGGMAAPETFDPKRYLPFEVGLPVEQIMSTFPAIDTVVDNIKISQGLEHIAGVDVVDRSLDCLAIGGCRETARQIVVSSDGELRSERASRQRCTWRHTILWEIRPAAG